MCGTPYVIDQGSGKGQVVQDCEYLVYASYCDFTVLDLVVVNTAEAMGGDSNPFWPATNLLAGQQVGSRYENYQVTFDANGESYSYSTVDAAEFGQFNLSSQWILNINTFGDIKDMRSK